jgi:hypothetical protein
MLSSEEYRAFEQAQRNKWEDPPEAQDIQNFEHWSVTRYYNNPRRYFITARHELGYAYKEYSTQGFWQGGTGWENKVYDEIQYAYRSTQGIRIVRTRVQDSVALFEVQFSDEVYGRQPLSMYAVINNRVLSADAKKLKDGARYNLKG